MTTTTTTEAQDVLDRALKLPAAEREQIALRLRESIDPPPNVYESEDALRAELLCRIEAFERGEMKTYTLEETLDSHPEGFGRGA